MRNGEAMNKSEPCAKWRNRVVLSILGVLLFPRGPLQAQGGVGQEVADLQKQSEAIASPIVQQQKAEQTVAAKRQSDAGGSSQSELRQEVDRALETSRRAEAEAKAKAKAAEKAAVEKLSAERKAIADKTAEEVKTAKEGVDKAAAELEASEKAAKTAAKLAAERRDAEKASISGAEEAEDQAERARRNVKRLAEKKAAAQKAAGEAKGDKAVLAAKTAETAVAAELTTAHAEADKAVAKAKTASDQKIAAMKARLEAERVRADVEGDVLRKRDAVKRAEDAYDLARRRNEDAVDKLEDAVRDAKSAFAEEQRRAEQKEAAAVQAERDRQREAKRLQEVKQAADQRDQEQRNRDLAKQRAQERARQLEDERNRAVAAKASAQAEKDIAGAKAGKAAADKAAVAAQARFESDKALAAKAAESSKLATAALAAAIAAEKTADEKVQKADSEQAASARSLKALSITADDAADAAADAKAELAKAVAALESAKAIVVKDPKNKAATDAKAAKVAAAEKRLADAKAAEAAAAAKLNSAGESEKAAATADAAKKTAALEARKALVSARASLDKAEDDAAAKAAAYKKAQGVLADSQDEYGEAKQSAAAAASALASAEGRLAAASKTLAVIAAAPVAGATQGSPSGATLGDVRLVSARHDDVDWFKTTAVEGGHTLFGLLDSRVRKGEPLADALLAVQSLAISNGYYLATFTMEDEKTIMIDKGRFGDVDVSFKDAKGEGSWYSKEQIKRKLEREGVAKGNVFDYNKLYSAFKELSAYPDLEVALRLVYDEKMAAGEKSEGMGVPVDELRMLGVAMQVKEDVPVHGVVGVDNFGTSSYDNWIGRATLQWLNPTRVDDAFTVNALGSIAEPGAMYGAAGSYYRPFILDERAKGPFTEGAFTLHGGYTEVDTEDVVPEIDVEGTGWFAGVQGSLRLFENRMHRLDLSAGITYRSIENGLVVADDRLDAQKVDVAPISLALLYTGKGLDSWNGRNYGTLEMVYNENGFLGTSEGEEIQLQRDNADEDFYLIGRAQVARVQMLSFGDLKGVSGSPMLFMKLDGQWAADPLIPAEQMGVGGHATVRGYEEREFLGDNAITGTLEFRTPIYLGILDRKSADAKGKPAGRYIAWDRTQLVFFFDFGWFQLEDALGKGEDDSKFLCSVGPGLRAAVGSNFQLRVDWGIPLKETSESEGAGAVHVSLQGQF